MKRKSLLFLMLMAMFAPLAMNAQSRSTLTVYGDNTTTNEYVPIYGYYADEQSKCEFIIPAAELSAMNGGIVSDMKFYLSSSSSNADISATFNVFVKEVSTTTLTGFTGTTNATSVYTSTISIPKNQSNFVLDIPFSSNYIYGGGNLLIGVYQTGNSSYNRTYWTGESQSGNTAWQGYGSGSGNGRKFLPKTTFTYEISTTPSIILPATATVLTSFTTTLTATTLNVTGTPSINYTSSNTSVATVSGSGTTATVTGVSAGTATITATMTYDNNTYTATCAITVEDPHACTPELTSTTTTYYISNFTTTGATTNINNSTSGTGASYSDYYNSYSASAYEGQTINFTITIAGGSTHGSAIWVDWNDDLEFSDNERVHQTSDYLSSPHTGSFTVPTGATLGDHRMRVVSDYYSSSPSNPCSASTGEFEDYKLTVIAVPSCMPITGLALSTDGATMTATWNANANATSYNVSVNGTVYPNATTTNSYTWNVNLSTTYTVMVEANCSGGETSGYCDPESMTTPDCIGGHNIEYTLNDSYNDSWNGASISVVEGCGDIVETITLASGAGPYTGTLTLCGDYYEFIWNSGNYDSECSFTFSEGGTTLFTKPSSVSNGQVLYTIGTQALPKPTALTAGTPGYDNVDLSWTENGSATSWEICINGDESNLVPANTNVNFNLTGLQPDNSYSVKVRAVSGNDESCWSAEVTVTTPVACARPENLTESNLTFTTVDLSWTGTANSYVAEYGTWTQIGTDKTATGTMTPYTFSLSDFSGKGTVAIRHYNINDQFRLNVDDIVVKDANGNIIYSENFESGSIPSIMSNIDLDGDGNIWGIGSNGTDGNGNAYCNGSYCATSASWKNQVILYPDNWLVIPDITLGGSITFSARGQDPSAAAEVFGVFVIADNQFTQAYSGSSTSCQVTGLTEGTAYAWRVQGDCGQYDSNWAFSMFKTPDNLLIFATAGNWNDLSNWTDIDGNAATALPTVDNKVRIDAAATIPSGVVATAKSALLNDGSITIQKGGQLKQGGSVKVTMYKGIEGYGANYDAETNNNGNYYFISTPHNCSYFEQNTTFPYVLNVTDGEYDLYAFDPTQELEWINYKNNPSHAEFHTGDNTGLFFMKGYLYANEDDTDLQYVGTVSSSLNNILTESFTYSETSTDDFNGWRLVGNPYTCDAYISYVDDNGNALSADFYTLDNSNTYTLLTSSDPLAPLTGAMVNFSATGTVQFASEAPAKANRTGMINMNLVKGNKSVDQVRVRFGQGHNLKHMSFRNNSKLCMPVEGNDYAVVYAENEGEMPVSFKAEENGTYTLNFNAEEVSFGYLHLIDNMTGNDVDLLQTPSYTFEAKTTDYASRFKLVFATGDNSNADNFAFFSNGSFVINNEGNATLQVIDVTGRIVKSESINGCANVNVNAAPGVYMLRLVNGDNVKVQKVVVK